jgi:hypothetical protein
MRIRIHKSQLVKNVGQRATRAKDGSWRPDVEQHVAEVPGGRGAGQHVRQDRRRAARQDQDPLPGPQYSALCGL